MIKRKNAETDKDIKKWTHELINGLCSLMVWFPVFSLSFPQVVKAFQEYTEPEEATPASPQRRAPTAGEDEAVVLPLGDNTLTHNLGIPVLIVCTKVNYVNSSPKSHVISWDNQGI